MANKHTLWVEKYRPKTVKECILPDDIKQPFQDMVDKGEFGNLMLSGSPGVGKTTIAKALCDEIGLEFLMINGSDERGIDVLRTKVKHYASSRAFNGKRKVIIIDEADFTTPELQAALRAAIEEFSSNCSFILTCNFKNKLMEAMHSRFSIIDFKLKNADKPKMAMQFYKRLETIFKNEEVEYDAKILQQVIQRYFPDYRRILNECQHYSVGGKLDLGILSSLSDDSIKDLVSNLKDKDFNKARRWISENLEGDAPRLFRAIYEGMKDYLEPSSIPQAVVLLADYQFKDSFVIDKEINAMACMTELMANLEFK
jgi:DNA polymerase III delta prime subunit